MHLRISELLEERGWSVYLLAQKLEGSAFGRTAVYRLGRGEMTRLTFDQIAALLEVFDIDADELFERRPARKRKAH